jgi:hypothetical protein
MARPTKSIALQYSNDGGVTFSTALEIKAKSVRVWKTVETNEEGISTTGRKFEKRFAYLNVTLETDEYEFDPSLDASGDDNWTDLQDFCDADTRRLYNNDTSNVPNLDGYTEFNADDNTNYLNLTGMDVIFRQGDTYPGGRRTRSMIIELQTRSAI